MNYDLPGRADQLSNELVEKWNLTIQQAYNRLESTWGSRFFTLDYQSLKNPISATIKWFADPVEPVFCIDQEAAQILSDWGVKGRHLLHNEYCEYRIVEKPDTNGKLRPKRVQITTELREYWVCLAKYDPNAVRAVASSILGFQPSWEELYGVDNPLSLNEQQREIAFARLCAGHGDDINLSSAGVPTQPTGSLNTDHALFMTHPINGLDDLLYIVMFGSAAYARPSETGLQPATKEQIFREFNVQQLACRHADPAAAMGAHGAAFEGRTVAFDNPIGMYILSFTKDVFLYQGQPVPDRWVRWSRGEKAGLYQHLEFGPGDEENVFLDDIVVAVGNSEQPLKGGFQILQQIEVGPLILVGEATPVKAAEYSIISANNEPIECNTGSVCERIRALQAEYKQEIVKVAPRIMGPRQ